VSGFRDAEHYYEMSSSNHLLSHIRVPTMILTSGDDPLIPFHIFESAAMSEFVHLHATEHGGHLGFLGRPNEDADQRWMDWRVTDWIKLRLAANSLQTDGSDAQEPAPDQLLASETRDV
jgi:predicted alpha/beta-fold hydrolase